MTRTVISLFTGVGGLDFGFEAAGFKTRVALDNDPVACRTVRLNRDWPVLEGGIEQFSSAEILFTAGLKPGQCDVLIGGPPCQPFSKSGYWATGDAGRLEDPRSKTLQEYLRVLEDAQPKAFLLENVPGLAYRGKNEGLAAIEEGIAGINRRTGTQYGLSVQTLNAASFGVPQMRERVFVIGRADGEPFKFPQPTHGEPNDLETAASLKPYVTTWDALGDLAKPIDEDSLALTGKWAGLLPSIPEGENYLFHTDRGDGVPLFGWRRRYWNFLLKVAKDRPSWTIQAQPGPATGPFHWDNRRFSAEELCRLQSFPDGLEFDCKRAEVQRLLGNAVPSALSEALARALAEQVLNASFDAQPKLIRHQRNDRPGKKRRSKVPSQYLALLDTDTAHPGTGKGRRAQAA